MAKVTILVDSSTRERLKYIGREDQTYDQIITELLDARLKEKENKKGVNRANA
jgi:hypothetical protein